MNNDLYIKIENLNKTFWELSSLIQTLTDFLKENESKFKNDESIKALNRIKVYLELKNKEYYNCKAELKQNELELRTTCKYEIAIKSDNTFYQCLICNSYLRCQSNIGPEVSIICIDVKNDYQTTDKIKKVLKDIMYNDRDLIEIISEYIEKIQYESDIKVYRRL